MFEKCNFEITIIQVEGMVLKEIYWYSSNNSFPVVTTRVIGEIDSGATLMIAAAVETNKNLTKSPFSG